VRLLPHSRERTELHRLRPNRSRFRDDALRLAAPGIGGIGPAAEGGTTITVRDDRPRSAADGVHRSTVIS
jgi:hypothetical protein